MQVGKEIRTIREAVDAAAESQPATAFLLSAETRSTISSLELQQNCILLSCMLRQAGLAQGDKVAFLMDNGLLTVQLFLGSMYGGLVAVPLNVRAGVMQLAYMLEHCDAKVVFTEEQYAALLGEALADVRRDIRMIIANVDGPIPAFETVSFVEPPPCPNAGDVALLMYSSGSTGKPKAAIHTHATVLAHGWNSIASHELTAADRSLLVLPLYHINAECVTLIPTLLSGGSVVVTHRFVVSKFWDWVDDLRVTWSALVPTIIAELVDWDDAKKGERAEAFRRIRFFRSSSAPLAPALHRQFLDKFQLPLLQAMGSTEGGNVFSNPQPPAKNKIGSPGMAWGFEIKLVDRQGTELPDGEAGEIVLRGPALMKGYYKDPEGTAAVLDSEGWFHTGDLARRDEDGYFFVVGRSKELIIKGGVNIAPRQIDEVLESHSAVLEAAAVGVPDRYFGEDAVAFAVLRPGAAVSENELLAFCESRLGHFKSPSRIRFLKELPKGPSGKVQRLKLLDPAVLAAAAGAGRNGNEIAHASDASQGNSAPTPVSVIEQIIAAAWAEVLSVPAVDAHTNFFALGGHSLLAIQCLSKLRGKLPIVLTINDFFENSTVAEQAELVRQRLRDSHGRGEGSSATHWEQSILEQFVPSTSEETIPRRNSSLPYPLCQAQQRLWFMEQLSAGKPVYNEVEAVRLTGELNVNALVTALNMIVARHELLRATIAVIDGVPHAVVHDDWPLHFERIDLSVLSAAQRELETQRLLTEKPRALFNLESEPGIRVALVQLSDREHVLILMMHHIICDWSSEGIIWRELSALYRSLICGQPAALPPLAITHGDYAKWRQKRIADEEITADLAFWEEKLRDASSLLEVPADRVRPTMMSYRGNRLRWKLDGAMTEKLRRTSQQEKVSLFTIFAAALNSLLYRYTGSDDILLGIPLADRDQQELQSVVGFLLHTHVLRTRIAGNMSFRELLGSVQKGTLELYAHRAAPFDQIVRRLGQERSPGHTPLFQVMLNWRDRDQQLSFIGMEGLAVESLLAHSNTSKFDLLLFATDEGEEIWLEMEYNADLFDEDRITRMLGHYQAVLESATADPAQAVNNLEILPAAERHQVLYEWNGTAAPYHFDTFVQQLIEAQVARTPAATALVFDDAPLSYAELNARANRLAHHLRELGVKPDARVAVCAERSFEMVIALLATLKAGGAYVPFDPTYPAERLGFMIDDAAPVVLLTQPHLKGLFATLDRALPVIDLTETSAWSQMPASDPDPRDLGLAPQHLAYVIYTSGSTGKPKGVMVQHQGLCNRFDWMQSAYPTLPSDTMLQKTPFTFDVSLEEFFPPLLAGARLVISRPEGHKDPAYLAEVIAKNSVTITHFVPSMLHMFLEYPGSASCTSLRRVVCSGEALPAALAQRFQQQLPGVELHNLYGPTEATVEVTAWKCPPGFKESVVPIGRPIANTRMYILDEQRQPVPVGVPGELYIGGVQVARGYLNRPELTAERFLADPFTTGPDARMYRTGDLSRWQRDGNIEYLGRNDFQVKIRGFRIELGEIENELLRHAGVRQCVVTAQGGDTVDMRLVAYLVPADAKNAPSVEDLRAALQRRLPSYMIPSVFAFIDEIPLTSNGKADIKKLMQSEVKTAQRETPSEAPCDEIEAELVQIWERVLNVRPIGVHDDFFALGGHSLIGVRLFASIKKIYQCDLELATLFQARTVRQLAALIRNAHPYLGTAAVASPAAVEPHRAWKSLVVVQPNGSRPPLFCVHAAGGDVLFYEQLAHALGPDQPFYAFKSPLVEQPDRIDITFEEMAALYIREMRAFYPSGPYLLGAASFGGYILYEMARQLDEQGVEPGMVLILDLSVPGSGEHFDTKAKLKAFFRNIRRDGWRYLLKKAREKGAHFWERFLNRVVHPVLVRVYLAAKWPLPNALRYYYHLQAHLRVLARHTFKPFPGKVTLVRARDRGPEVLGRREDPTLGWGSLALGGVEVIEVPTHHIGMLFEPYAKTFAEQLKKMMAEAVDRSGTLPAENTPALDAVPQ
jgi:amino acid adenylation domain-containing protein